MLNEHKHKARIKVWWRLVHGTIIKPDECVRCQSRTSDLEAHHPDYSKPLEIQWLCVPCHVIVHPHPNPNSVGGQKGPRGSRKLKVKERPILFSGEMVRAILEGRKTQTRRVVKPQPVSPGDGAYFDAYNGGPQWNWWAPDNKQYLAQIINCPYGKPGDRLWVREKITVARSASSLSLEITNVRVERLQEITFADCIAEGMPPIGPENDPECVRNEFQTGWDSLNAKHGFSWESNPWVWVIEFKSGTE